MANKTFYYKINDKSCCLILSLLLITWIGPASKRGAYHPITTNLETEFDIILSNLTNFLGFLIIFYQIAALPYQAANQEV